MMVRCFFPQWKEQQKQPGTADEWTSCGGFNDILEKKIPKKWSGGKDFPEKKIVFFHRG